MEFYENGELKDQEIINALIQAEKDYKNGEIAEVRDMLEKIIGAIDDFENGGAKMDGNNSASKTKELIRNDRKTDH